MNYSGNMRRNNNQMPPRGGGGPLMTDHLHDLELELELLKRKRQLIQRQGNMLYNQPGGSDIGNLRYNQPSQSYNQYNEPQRNFSHLYNDAPRNNQGFGQKRQAVWANSPGNNSGPKRSRPNPFVQPFQNNAQSLQRPGFMPQPLLNTPKPSPLMNFPVQRNRPMNRPNQKQNQGSRPSHHTNFKQNKAANRPGFAHKKNTTPKKPVQNPSPSKTDKKETVFTPDKKSNNKINGRIELALGTIIKELKEKYMGKPEYKSLFISLPLARVMKQGVRERLHNTMLGKPIDKTTDIVAEYRQKYPCETDKDILELAILEQRKSSQKVELAIKLLEEGDPEQYFKKNMIKLIQARFSLMLGKLQKMMEAECEETKTKILGNLPDIKKLPPPLGTSKNSNAQNEGKTEGETPAEEPVEKTPEAAEETQKSVETEKAEETQKSEESEKTEQTADDEPVFIDEDIFGKEINYNKWLSFYIQRRMSSLLHRHRVQILKIFDLDQMFANTRAAITMNANKKAQAIKVGDPEMPRNLPYFAKVLATPTMPKRKMMQEFLDQFQPKTIKRHKKNSNLLFVGFDKKENYDKILAANQTVIGDSTLGISGNTAKNNTTIEIDDQNDIDKVLTPQLDDQIDELLTSIRKADEDSKADETVAEVDLTNDESLEVVGSNGNVEPDDATATNETEANDTQVIKGNGDATETANGASNGDDKSDDCQVVEANEENVVTIEDDEVAPLKEDVKKPATPAKGKAPATPRTVNTRRSSRLQN